MAKSLVIVESPAKARTINKFLGRNYIVRACMGHIMDLPRDSMGVDIKNNFRPRYVIVPGRKRLLSKLKMEVKDKDGVYLAPDPDREGEAIAWHLSKWFGRGKKVYRVIFHEITKKAIGEAFRNPGDLDLKKVNAQQARRILDRLVGYNLSPLLWKKVGRGLSAGRVQSVAVRLIVEREKRIKAFVPEEYWEIEAELKKKLTVNSLQFTPLDSKHLTGFTEKDKKTFKAKLEKIEDKKAKIDNKDEADKIVAEIRRERFIVSQIKERQRSKYPAPAFITSSLQQDAFTRLHFPPYKTMKIAQQLYEGLEIGKEGGVGLITYMRTDSVRISGEAQNEAKGYISSKYGKDFVPAKPYRYKSKRTAQEAHEAIRPTSVFREPEALKEFLTPDQYKLYKLIWEKFLASQMAPALFLTTTAEITVSRYLFRASGSRVLFPGFTIIYTEEKKEEKVLPPLSKGEMLECLRLIPSQHFTQPPPRYSDASLVKALEDKGIGRPSTYAPILQTIVFRDYVRREGGYLFPTELGIVVTGLLTKHFPKILDVRFTADLEKQLDRIEDGNADWVEVVSSFYDPFIERFACAQRDMRNLRKEIISTDELCDKCGRPMVVRWGRGGRFLGCSGFPKCKTTRPLPTGIKCPQPGCGGELTQRRSKSGRIFWGCTNYPKCKYVAGRLPAEDNRNQ